MILHIAPDYMNKPIYRHLIEGLQATNGTAQCVFACDNAIHDVQNIPQNVYVVNHPFSVFERLLFFPKQRYLLKEIEKTVPLEQIDLIHAHTLFSSGYLAYRLHKKYGIPYIVAVRNTDVNVFFRYMRHLRHIGKKIAKHAQKIIFISPAYKEQVLGTYLPQTITGKSIVLPNGIDPIFLQRRTKHEPDRTTIRLIYIGRIEKDKNINTIIRVADQLVQNRQPVALCLVGKIIDAHYASMIKNRSYITWHDQCAKEEVLQYLQQNDIFIMPSYHETFGLVYAEAMSQGLPLVYTKGQGFDGFFEDGCVGYAVPSDNVSYITSKVMDIHRHYNTFSERCVQNVSQFDWQNIVKNYTIIYQDCPHGTR